MPILDWLGDFVGWLRTAVGTQKLAIALETHTSKDGLCKLFLLADERSENLPGLVQLWLLTHAEAHFDLLIILVNLAQARETRGKAGIDSLPKDWHREFESKARQAVQQQGNIAASHLFLTGWVSKQPIAARFVRSKLEYFRRVECSVVLALDLQGNTFAWAGNNEYAAKIVKAIAYQAMLTHSGTVLTWEELMRSLDDSSNRTTWLTWLQYFATHPKKTRIGAQHILQPPRSRFSFRTPQGEL